MSFSYRVTNTLPVSSSICLNRLIRVTVPETVILPALVDKHFCTTPMLNQAPNQQFKAFQSTVTSNLPLRVCKSKPLFAVNSV